MIKYFIKNIWNIISAVGTVSVLYQIILYKRDIELSNAKQEIEYIKYHLYDFSQELFDMLKEKNFCEDNPESISANHGNIIQNINRIYDNINQVNLQTILLKDKQLRDLIEYFVLNKNNYYYSNNSYAIKFNNIHKTNKNCISESTKFFLEGDFINPKIYLINESISNIIIYTS